MASAPVLFPPSVRRLPTTCPMCSGEISVYVFVRAVDCEQTPRGLELSINTSHQIGPHACCTPEAWRARP